MSRGMFVREMVRWMVGADRRLRSGKDNAEALRARRSAEGQAGGHGFAQDDSWVGTIGRKGGAEAPHSILMAVAGGQRRIQETME